jgi:putative glutamine amidotransferase
MSRVFIPVTGAVKVQLNQAYIDFIEKQGHEPRLVIFNGTKNLKKTWRKLKYDKNDILLLPGGVDIDPTLFGFNNKDSYFCNRNRDLHEINGIDWALERGLQIFGICRGLQLFCVHKLGYSILWWQDIDGHNQGINKLDRNQTFHFAYLTNIENNPLTYWAVTTKSNKIGVAVNSLHHQAIEWKELNRKDNIDNWTIDILANISHRKTNIIEALQIKENNKIVFAGVQWHPEELEEHRSIMNIMLGKEDE